MTIKIDQNVPLPQKNTFGALKYPFRKMEIGDSFFIPNRSSTGISTDIYKPKKFTMRAVTENGVKGVRVWRIE